MTLAAHFPPGMGSAASPLPEHDNFVKTAPLIVLLGEKDWAHVGHRLAEAVNKHTLWEARVIVKEKVKEGFPVDILEDGKDIGLIRNLLLHADYVLYISSNFNYAPLGLQVPSTTPRGLWHGGSTYRSNYNAYNRIVHPHFDHVFAHRDIKTLGKGIQKLQAPYDTEKYQYIPKNFDGKIIVGHSPSLQSQKGTTIFQQARNRLKQKYKDKIEFSIMSGLPWNKVLERKKQCHIFFDQIAGYHIPPGATHGYGVSLVEAAAYGAVCVGGCDYKDTPILPAKNANQIVNAISGLMDKRTKMANLSKRTREWVVKEHGYRNVVAGFISKINQVSTETRSLLEPIKRVFQRAKGGFKFGKCWVYDFQKGAAKDGCINVPYVRDIPILQCGNKNIGMTRFIEAREELKRDDVHHFIAPSLAAGKLIKQHIFKRDDIDFDVYRNYPPMPKNAGAKREEIVYIDNSCCNYDNYEKVLKLLKDIEKQSGIPTVMVSKSYSEEAMELNKGIGISRVLPLNKYDYKSKYGVLLDAMDPVYASISMPRKFLDYLVRGMLPLIHRNFTECINYLKNTHVAYKAYGTPSDLKNVKTLSPTHDGREFALESNYIALIDILRQLNEKIKVERKSIYSLRIN